MPVLRLFPLRTVVFPGQRLPLHIFEERYRQLVREVLTDGALFGVALIREGAEAGGGAVPEAVGCAVHILEAHELAGGRFHVLCEGRQRFRIRATLPDAPYPRADVDFLPAPSDAASDEAQDLAAQVRDLFTTHLRLTLAIEGGWQRAFRLPDRPDALADHVAGQVDAVVAVKQQILQTPAAVERLRMVRHMLAVENAALTERLAGRRQLSLGGLGVLN